MKHDMGMHPRRRDELPGQIALWAAVADLHDIIDLIEGIGDEDTRNAVRIWIASSRLHGLWQ